MKATQWYLSASLLILSGCASTPVQFNQTRPIQRERVLAFQSPKHDGSSAIVVIRDEGAINSNCYIAFYINDILSARLDPGEAVELFVDPGEIILSAGSDPMGRGLCNGPVKQIVKRETQLKPGEKKAFRITTDQNGRFDIMRTDL